MPTPNLQAFAASGVTFTRHYADSTCQPARTALLTGLYAPALDMRPTGRGIPAQVPTLPDRLDKAGYETYHVGKWHLGYEVREAWPKAQGFDHWFGFLSQFLLQGPGPNGEKKAQWPPTYRNPWLQKDGGRMKQYKGQLTDILTRHAVKKIEKLSKSKKPLFINLWTFAPHTPYEPAPRFARRF
jgi:arylsulfatase A-like enzyme